MQFQVQIIWIYDLTNIKKQQQYLVLVVFYWSKSSWLQNYIRYTNNDKILFGM